MPILNNYLNAHDLNEQINELKKGNEEQINELKKKNEEEINELKKEMKNKLMN